jgi:glycosyltransferase involved in cell wall biosynthesis
MGIFQDYITKKTNNKFQSVDVAGTSASIFVVIPCYNEPCILDALNSLAACYPPESKVAVIIVVNSSEDSGPEVFNQNQQSLSEVEFWKKNHPSFLQVCLIQANNLPRKFAGVGWARKIGMDEAVKQIYLSDQEDGIIVSFDADSTVAPNYLREIERAFGNSPECNFFTIQFAHPLIDESSSEESEGILRYELHMRYYRNAMKWCGYPHAIHTVGSSFAVRASSYVKQGGMNRRKAGEDFYFLHKLVFLGKYGNINSTTVFPSARQSDRVPFGTGAAMKKWAEGNPELITTYNLDAFIPLKEFFAEPSKFTGMNESRLNSYLLDFPDVFRQYIRTSESIQTILELKKNCANEFTFTKRFFHSLNAFWILKYLNFVHENFYKKDDLYGQAERLLKELGINVPVGISSRRLLNHYRVLDEN